MKKHDDDTLKARVDRAVTLVREMDRLLHDLIELDVVTRKHSIGKLREGETDAMRAVLDAADAREVTNAAYHIARVNSDADPKLKTHLAPAFAFYARGGRPKKKNKT